MVRNMYRLGIYEKAIPDFESWLEKLDTVKQGGFDWLELSVDESEKKQHRLDFSSYEISKIKKAISLSGVPIHTMCLSAHRKYPLGSRDVQTRTKSLDIMKKAVYLSSEIGIRLIQLAGYDVYYEEHGNDTERFFLENLIKTVELASSYGVSLGFETMETPFMDTAEKAMKYVLKLDSPFLGLYPDIGNLKNASLIYGTNVVSDLRNGHGHIFAAHLKETLPGIYRNLFFGEGGHTEYTSCIEELWKQGVRMFTGEFWYNEKREYKSSLLDASNFLREKIEQVIKCIN